MREIKLKNFQESIIVHEQTKMVKKISCIFAAELEPKLFSQETMGILMKLFFNLITMQLEYYKYLKTRCFGLLFSWLNDNSQKDKTTYLKPITATIAIIKTRYKNLFSKQNPEDKFRFIISKNNPVNTSSTFNPIAIFLTPLQV